MWGPLSAAPADATGYDPGRFVSRRSSQRPVAVALVAVVHLIAVWTIFGNIRPSPIPMHVAEFQITVVKPAATTTTLPPLRESKLMQPHDAFVPEPEIQIAPDSDSPPVATSVPGQVLPPRPDPYYINKAPDVPDNLREEAIRAAVTLRILVLPDGFVQQALLVKGSGNAALDKVALAFVEANWRFLPAASGGKAIQSWTTVRVRFA